MAATGRVGRSYGPSSFPSPSSSSSASSASSAWVPQHHRDITLGRLDGFLGANQFADVNIRSELWARTCGEGVALEVYSHPKDVPYPSYDEAVRMPYRPAAVGDSFGPSWTTHWFRVRARVPPDWDGLGPLMFRWDSGSEAMLYPCGPTPRQGFTDGRNEYVLAEKAQGGQELLFYVEMAANGMFGTALGDNIQPPDENRYFTLRAAELVIPNVPVTALFHDLRALLGLARELPPGNATGEAALYTANKIVNTYRRGDPASVEACRALAAGVLGQRDAGERLQVYAVGHCHIDTAWLWPFSETHRKTARSWSSQLRLAERFPWHVFTASSAQQYEWLLQDYPGLFAEIQAAAARGSFLPVGGTWVEMDTNLPSGESLVRQFLYGQRFFESYFGARCDVFWLPDTFGYSGQLPQIAAGAGIRYFLTQKLSWNNINAFPHSTFFWAGLDGSRLLTHFPPANTYCSQADAHDIIATAANSKDKDRAPAALLLYGAGDGGGGPTADMCESLARLGGCRGAASVSVVGPGEFFRRLEAGTRDLLTWRGELYFELHRGTYTSHAANKSGNRGAELLLREVEAAGALAAAVLPAGSYTYPRSEIDAIWKEVLLYQFHDVLPGSAIGRVYEVTAARYPIILSTLRKMREEALSALLSASAAAATAAATAASAQGHVRGDTSATMTGDRLAFGQVAGARPLPDLISLADCEAGPVDHSGNDAARGDGASAGQATHGSVAAAAPPPPAAWAFNSLAFPRREVAAVPLALLPPGSGGRARQLSADGGAALVLVAAPPLSLTPVSMEDVAAGYTAAAAAAAAAAGGGSSGTDAAGGAAVLASMQGLSLGSGGGGGADAVTAMGRPNDPWVGGGAAIARVGREALRGMGVAVPQAVAAAPAPAVTADPVAGAAAAGALGVGDEVWYVMQNNTVRAVFSEAGRLVSLYDMVWRRELVPEGAGGNVFRMYEDIPLYWDAWDIEIYHLEKGWDAGAGMPPPKVSILESGPLRCRLGIELALSPTSSLKQTISMTAVSPRLDFRCEVAWSESRTALKAEFPWRLDAPAATYEVQHGAVQRPTHGNTSWDWARFEVCAHKWADLSEPGYGVALLNDCKYGHATHGNVMRLTLLRAPKAPDANTDMGTHALRFALLPHALDWATAGVAAHGWAFNAPLRMLRAPPPPPPPPPSQAASMGTVSAVSAAAAPQSASPSQAAAMGSVSAVAAAPTGRSGLFRLAAEQGAYDPSQPMFTVTSARPNPLLSAGAATRPPAPLTPPPLILDTVKLPEPPLERRHHGAPPAAAAAAATAAAAAGGGPATTAPPYSHGHGNGHSHGGNATYGPAQSLGHAAANLHQQTQQQRAPLQAGHGISGSAGPGASASPSPSPSALVLRLYEPHGARGVARVAWPAWLRVGRVAVCNLLEDEESEEQVEVVWGELVEGDGGGRPDSAGGSVEVPYAPYKIITLKLYLQQDSCC